MSYRSDGNNQKQNGATQQEKWINADTKTNFYLKTGKRRKKIIEKYKKTITQDVMIIYN